MTPIAPMSSARVRYWWSCEGTRTSGVIPAPIAAEHSSDVVSSEVAVCSRSTYTASNPAAAAIVGMSAVRAWVRAMHSTSCPASSRSRIEGMPCIMLAHRPWGALMPRRASLKISGVILAICSSFRGAITSATTSGAFGQSVSECGESDSQHTLSM